jgi:hypothetical protein
MTWVIDVNLYLVITIFLLSFTQTGKGRLSALIYATILVIATIVSLPAEGYQFFLTSAFADFIAVVVICSTSLKYATSRISDILISLSICSGAINAFGAFTWYSYEPLIQYNIMCMIVYSIAVMTLLLKGEAHDAGGSYIFAVFRVIGYPGFAIRSFIRNGEAT